MRITKLALDYLAVVHVTGSIPKGMHKGTDTSLAVWMNSDLDVNALRWKLKPEALPLIEDHPLIRSFLKLEEAGYKVDRDRIRRYRRWTISKGVPLLHTEDRRDAYLGCDGRARQCDGPDGKWAPKSLGNPGKETASADQTIPTPAAV